MRRLLLLAACACLFAGCGNEDQTANNLVAEYNKLFAAWQNNDAKTACAMMGTGYQHKLAAELQEFGADCPALITEIHKQTVGKDAIKNLSVQQTGRDAVLVRTKLTDGTVRTRFKFENRDGKWIVVDDDSLDASGPQEPVKAYKAQARGADPEILWSEVVEDRANIWQIEGNGKGSFTLYEINLERSGGTWRVVHKTVLGTAPQTANNGGVV